MKEEVIKSFTKESSVRIVIATRAFGMGADCHDVRQIIHFLPLQMLNLMSRKLGMLDIIAMFYSNSVT